jgi:hypothetical protein
MKESCDSDRPEDDYGGPLSCIQVLVLQSAAPRCVSWSVHSSPSLRLGSASAVHEFVIYSAAHS